ncbi:unnamed protein product [Closterium sp. NIES-64]|nr:unnamed protein product [Closterium sp. NIES-64]
MHRRVLVSGLPRTLPPLPASPAPTCLPCVEGRQRAAPHSSSFPPTEAPLQTLHMDVWGPARVSGRGGERYFLLSLMTTRATPRSSPCAPRVRRTAAQPLAPCLRSGDFAHTTVDGEVGDASVFRVWGARALVRDTSADKLSSRTFPCVFLGFPTDAPGWQFYHPPRALSCPPPVEPLPPQGPAPSGVSQVDPPPLAEPVEVTSVSGEVPEGAEPVREVLEGAEPGGAEPVREVLESAELRVLCRCERSWRVQSPGGARTGGTRAAEAGSSGGAAGGAAGAAGGAGGATVGAAWGATGAGGAAGSTGGGSSGSGGAGAAGAPGGDAGAAGGAGGAIVGAAGAAGGGTAGSGGAERPQPYFVPLLEQVLGLPPSPAPPPSLECPPPVLSPSQLQPTSPLPAPSPYAGPTGGLTERREPASRPASPVRVARTGARGSRQRSPPIPGTHRMSLRPSTAPQRVPLPSPPESSLPALVDPESDSLRAASPTVTRLLATVVTHPSFELLLRLR